MLYSDVEAKTLYYLLQMMIPLLLCRQQGEEAMKRHTACGTAGETYMLLLLLLSSHMLFA